MTKFTKEISRRAMAGLALAAGLGLALPAVAEDWPTRAVTLVVPYGPGASNDTFTRAVAEILSQKLGQPFVVENRAGAGGFTGAASVAAAEPDGYTFLEAPNAIVSYKPLMKVEDDPLDKLQPVGLLARAPSALVVPSGLGVSTVAEFIAYAKAHPDDTFYGAAGIGTTQNQHMELFNKNAGTAVKMVNYKSSADAQTDLVAGRLQAMIVTVASTLGQIEGGQLKLLAYTDDNYPAGAPEAPTLAEAGVPNMENAQIFWAMFAPKGVSPEIVAKLNAALNEALADPSFVALAAKSGASTAAGTPADLAAVLEAEAAQLQSFLELGVVQ